MPRIFDNIEQRLLPALQATLDVSHRADFCVGYFNLRGWRQIDAHIESWAGGPGTCCRLLVGMHRSPDEELREAYRFRRVDEGMDNQTALQVRKRLAEEFRQQLTLGAPSNQDEEGLRRLARQIREGRLVVKLFLRHPLHAKLYILHRQDVITPIVGYLGSSNLTFSGLAGQGELNVDVVEQDAAQKLTRWFEARWNDCWCLDISQELADIIDESWAGEKPIPPYYIYLKMAYHLSREARAGLAQFTIPAQFRDKLFDFQTAAVRIAARHLNRRGGVLIGDVVGLGKTIMASALAKIFEEDFDTEALILCPKNLVSMWESYRDDYGLRAKVLSISRVQRELAHLRRYRLLIIDESHNLRNPEGVRYRAIREYIQANESRCVLLTATPYNKTYLDLSSQLGLFVQEVRDLGIRPERLLREIGEIEFNRRYQCGLRTLEAFEKSPHPDDWRDLMGLFMVRRTRTFIQKNYSRIDPATGRKYLSLADGTRAFFPERRPCTVRFDIDEHDPSDQYARLYADEVVEVINGLRLPRYGLGNYKAAQPARPPTAQERQILDDLARGGRRLMGFCRTNLFKRLESSGQSFLLSVERHALRNFIFLHALARGLPLPVGTQGLEMLDPRFEDEDAEAANYASDLFDDGTDEVEAGVSIDETDIPDLEPAFEQRAATVYGQYWSAYRRRFRWIRADLFTPSLAEDLRADALSLIAILRAVGAWDATRDAKLGALKKLLTQTYPGDKVLVFSQFADTVRYLADNLKERGVVSLAGVTGDSPDPTALAWRFSPESNGKRERVTPIEELRVLIATDVLSEGQNLQDCCTVVNYDLPWAIIRLIQRAGRVDRIGQQSAEIACHTFWPADGVDRIIRLRQRLRQRLRENAEVVGTDEAFFEDDEEQPLVDLYHETAGVLDDEADNEVDLVSYAYQIWKNAIEANPPLERAIQRLPNVAYSAKAQDSGPGAAPGGALVFAGTGDEQNSLVWIDERGRSVTESPFDILRAAECSLDTAAVPRPANHHNLVCQAVERIMVESVTVGGQLGSRMGARFRTYERLMPYANRLRGTLLESLPDSQALYRAVDQIYRFPLREGARDRLNRQLRAGVQDHQLAELVVSLYQDDRLCLVQEGGRPAEPTIICSLGLVGTGSE